MRLLLIGAFVALAELQAALPPGPGPAPVQTFRSAAQIVEVDVRVLGKDGRFVTDLSLADFEITEDGVPHKVLSLVLIGSGAATSAPLAGSAPAAAAPQAPSPALAPPPPQTWLFVFDTTHLTPGGLTRTRDAVMTFLAAKFRQGDIGGIVADGRMVNNRLTSDREELRRAAGAVKAVGDGRSLRLELQEWPRLRDELEAFNIVNNDREALQVAVARACSDDPSQCGSADVQIMAKAKRLVAAYKSATRLTLSVVDTLSKGLARMAGPKTIVFLSEGFVLQEQESELRQAVGQATRAGARVYSVDARGLNTGTGAHIIDQAQADSPIGVAARFDMQSDGANSLAVDTGGFAIRNENNFGRALDEIQKDAGTYYVIGYAPVKETFDGKYRAISVKVSRPGVKVRARRGYLALPAAALLRATASAPAAVPPKPASDGAGAKAALVTPELPVSPSSPGMPALPEPGSIPLPGEPPRTSNNTDPVTGAVRARIDAGGMLMALGRSAAAEDSAGGLSGTHSAEAERGWAAYQKGDVETAARHLGEAAKAPGARPWVAYALGLSQFALRRFPEAAQAWERVRRDVPEFEPVYFSLAHAYGLQREDGTALKVLREAERRWPADAEVANAIGVIQIRRGALDAAIESFERAARVTPSESLGFFNLARTHQMRLLKSQRYDPQMQKWIGGDEDRHRATANFQKYLELGGPYEREAREALASLAWK